MSLPQAAASPLASIPTETLADLASALRQGLLRPPFTAISLRRHVGEAARAGVADFFKALTDEGLSSKGLARVCQLVVEERASSQTPAPELVWTGPEMPGAAARDTSVVVRQMLQSAETSILLSSYNLYEARSIFEPMVERMKLVPALRVKLYVNLTSDKKLVKTEAAYRKSFLENFFKFSWPGGRTPEIYYDRRLFQEPPSVLHAKCVVVDERDVIVSSANLSAPAYGEGASHKHGENIEAGLRVQNPTLAQHLLRQFESLVHAGVLVPLSTSGGG